MTNGKMQATAAEQLRLKLIGKPLVGFDTRHWAARATDGSIKGRTGTKAGTKTAPAGV